MHTHTRHTTHHTATHYKGAVEIELSTRRHLALFPYFFNLVVIEKGRSLGVGQARRRGQSQDARDEKNVATFHVELSARWFRRCGRSMVHDRHKGHDSPDEGNY